jgi:hypothetical protein
MRRSHAGARRAIAVLAVVAATASTGRAATGAAAPTLHPDGAATGAFATTTRAPGASLPAPEASVPAPEASVPTPEASVPTPAPATASDAAPSADTGRLVPVDGRRLADTLRAGGHVLSFRHTRTRRDQLGFERDMLATGRLRVGQCDTQRNLNEDGLRDARRQAEALETLRAAPGPVVASRYGRAWQHAMHVAGRVDPYDDALTPPRDAGKVASLRALLAGRPCCASRIGWQGRRAPPE